MSSDVDNLLYEECAAYFEAGKLDVDRVSTFLRDGIDIVRAEALDFLLQDIAWLDKIQALGMLPMRDDSWIVRGRIRLAWALLNRYNCKDILYHGEVSDDYDIIWHFAASCIQLKTRCHLDALSCFISSSDLTIAETARFLVSFVHDKVTSLHTV